jgi:type 1 glutamine amidotransferase
MKCHTKCCLSLMAVVVFLTGTSVAQARPLYLAAFIKEFADLEPLAKATKCSTCHFGKSKKNRNPYGKRIEKELDGRKKVTEDVIRKVLRKVGRPKLVKQQFVTAGDEQKPSPKAAAIAVPGKSAKKLKLLIIDGQNNHDWRATTPILKEFLESSGRFTVAVATSPPPLRIPKKASKAEADRTRALLQVLWEKFRPKFADYDVVLSNYNGEPWPKPVQKGLEDFVAKGGGLVIVHAANNAFPQWAEFNKMIGLGWRGNSFGERVTVDDKGKVLRTPKGEGPGAGHGPQHAFTVIVRDPKHPVTKDMPREWMHFKDELYHGQRGPARNMHILATAYSDEKKGGTGTHEPMVWWIPYGKGRVFTTVMGHADYSMQCVGFQTVVLRGAEWAATGKVTIPIPKHFPTATDATVILPRRKK